MRFKYTLSQVQTGVVSRCCSRRLTVMLMQMKSATFWFNKKAHTSLVRVSQVSPAWPHAPACTGSTRVAPVASHHRGPETRRSPREPVTIAVVLINRSDTCASGMCHSVLGGLQDREIKRSECFLPVFPWYYGLLVQITAATPQLCLWTLWGHHFFVGLIPACAISGIKSSRFLYD